MWMGITKIIELDILNLTRLFVIFLKKVKTDKYHKDVTKLMDLEL